MYYYITILNDKMYLYEIGLGSVMGIKYVNITIASDLRFLYLLIFSFQSVSQDCADAGDEKNCSKQVCHPDQFMCKNGECISHSFVCDAEDVSLHDR